MKKTCKTCAYWSELAAKSEGRCENDLSPKGQKYTYEGDTCRQWAIER